VAVQYQPALSPSQRKGHRTTAQDMARQGELATTQLGKNGLTLNFAIQLADLLSKRQYVKVRTFMARAWGVAAHLRRRRRSLALPHQLLLALQSVMRGSACGGCSAADMSQNVPHACHAPDCAARPASCPTGTADALQRVTSCLAQVRVTPNLMDTCAELAPVIEETNDCVCVHTVGSVMTFYRAKGLPRPDGVPLADNAPPGAVRATKVRQSAAAGSADRRRIHSHFVCCPHAASHCQALQYSETARLNATPWNLL